MSRFNSNVPMDDSSRGFFGILNAFFDQLAAEETAACDWAGVIPTNYPPFGKAGDNYNAMAKPFYNVWAGFSTKKTFSWRDKYRLQEAPDRRIRRLMEKENKKFRDEGIREFNDAVISLVTFVKKRDPRYVPNTQSEAERQQALRDSAAAQAARSRAAHQEKLAEYVVPGWAQSLDEVDYHDEFSMSESEEEIEEIECVVCNKIFKSEKQFEAHEKSKKHTKAVQQLKWQMRKENVSFDLQDTEPTSSASPSARLESDIEEDDTLDVHDVAPHESNTPPTQEEDPDHDTPSISGAEDDEYAPRSAVEDRILHGTANAPAAAGSQGDDGMADVVDSIAASLDGLALDKEKGDGKKVGKAKLKREKRAARKSEAQESHSVSPFPMPPQMYTAKPNS